ncbi:MAG TPA: hypothetical protein VK623_00275 [Flavobacterium sp.]|nr:hypothetical protein [Flavobacterium sp.]
MAFSRKYYRLPANSILESVIALCIISVCLYIAVLIFSAVFTPRTSAKFYNTQNRLNELFFISQLNDSLLVENSNKNLLIEEEAQNAALKKIIVRYKDSIQPETEKIFYVTTE